MSIFPKFWYESNAVWGNVTSLDELREKLNHQTDKNGCGIFSNKNEFLDKSFQNENGNLDFGTRKEHSGKKTLRQFLVENSVDLNDL